MSATPEETAEPLAERFLLMSLEADASAKLLDATGNDQLAQCARERSACWRIASKMAQRLSGARTAERPPEPSDEAVKAYMTTYRPPFFSAHEFAAHKAALHAAYAVDFPSPSPASPTEASDIVEPERTFKTVQVGDGYETIEIPPASPTEGAPAARQPTKRSCNRHDDCSTKPKGDPCCTDDCCEDCFGR